jgi:hypothetical protein
VPSLTRTISPLNALPSLLNPVWRHDSIDSGELSCLQNDNTQNPDDIATYMPLPDALASIDAFCEHIGKDIVLGPGLPSPYQAYSDRANSKDDPENGAHYPVTMTMTWNHKEPDCPTLDFSDKSKNPGKQDAVDICKSRLGVPIGACESNLMHHPIY